MPGEALSASRSRSPYRTTRSTRSRSPEREREHDSLRDRRHHRHHDDAIHRRREGKHREDRHGRHRHKNTPPAKPVRLPFKAQPITKHDLSNYRAMFASYLDIQKHINISDIPGDEVKGRWKSFVNKWNRGELAEGWYDPSTKTRADEASKLGAESLQHSPVRNRRASPSYEAPAGAVPAEAEESEDSDIGPSLPEHYINRRAAGPAIPRREDLQLRDEQAQEDAELAREDHRYARKLERKQQKEHLEELVPRAEPGTRERQLEKKRETAAANRSFREAKSPGAEEVGERDLMGGEDDIKARRREMERKKNERELRKEEVLRARAAEREERLAVHREKEEKTMDMLKALARQRFG